MDFKSFKEIKAYVHIHTLDELMILPLQNLGAIYGCVYQHDSDVQSMIAELNASTIGKYAIILGDTVQEEVRDIKEQFVQYELMYETMLADELSKEVLFSLLAFRLTRLDKYILKAFRHDIQQYFDPSIAVYKKNCVYADCGALDGYTTAQFMLHCPSYGKIYLYEPMEEYYQNCVSNIDTLQAKNIILRKAAVSDKNATLHFSANLSGSSKADEAGKILVNAVTLDDDILEPISFIKMDIEGSEKEALRGAEGHIKDDTPMLAICVYHLPRDLREIPFLIQEMNSSYHFYLRHHQYNPNETVLYAAPKSYEKSDVESSLPSNVEMACRRLTERLEKREKAELDLSKRYLMLQVENYIFNTQTLLHSVKELQEWSAKLDRANEYLSAEVQKRDNSIKELRAWSDQLNKANGNYATEAQRQASVIKQQEDLIKEMENIIERRDKALNVVANENKKLRYYLKEEIEKAWYKKLLRKSKESDYNI